MIPAAAAAEASHGVVFETCNFTRRAEATGSGPEAEAEAHMFVHLVTSTIYANAHIYPLLKGPPFIGTSIKFRSPM